MLMSMQSGLHEGLALHQLYTEFQTCLCTHIQRSNHEHACTLGWSVIANQCIAEFTPLPLIKPLTFHL